MIAVVLAAGVAWAHPFGAQYAAHRVDVHVGADAVAVHYIAEVPSGLLRGPDGLSDMKMELLSGLVLQVDGATVPLVLAGPAEVQENDDSVQIGLRLHADLEAPPTEVLISDGNLPDVAGVFSSTATVESGFSVLESSLLSIRNGVVTRDDSDRWHMGAGHRETRLHVAAASPVWSWLGPWSDGEPIGVAAAYPPAWSALLRRPVVTPTVAAIAVLLALGAGLAAPKDRDWRIAAACWVPVAPLAFWLPSPATEILAALLAIVALALSSRSHIAATTLLVGAIALATHAIGLALLIIAVHLGGTALRHPHRGATGAIAGVVAAAMLLRIAIE